MTTLFRMKNIGACYFFIFINQYNYNIFIFIFIQIEEFTNQMSPYFIDKIRTQVYVRENLLPSLKNVSILLILAWSLMNIEQINLKKNPSILAIYVSTQLILMMKINIYLAPWTFYCTLSFTRLTPLRNLHQDTILNSLHRAISNLV